MFGVTILGNNSAIPAHDRHPTAQAVTLQDQIILIDCGEGTQMQLSRYRIRRSKIQHILISHLHGDHYYGLIGLITSMGLLGRETDLHIHAPARLESILQMQLEVADTRLPFQLVFHPLMGDACIIQHPRFEVFCFSTEHRIPCWGFLIREKRTPRRINKQTISRYQIPPQYFDRLKQGEDFITESGEHILNEWVTIPNKLPRSYAYCADTRFEPRLANVTNGVNLLYHEATYLNDLKERALARFHSTSIEAAEIARLAGAGQLLIGHFSSKYDDLTPFLTEARAVFPATELAIEGVTYQVTHPVQGSD